MIAFWILLILSAFYFALLAWEKRTDSDSDNHRSTNERTGSVIRMMTRGTIPIRVMRQVVMRQAVVIDVSHKAPGQGVTADDLDRTGVRPGPGQIAVIKTLWTDRAFGKPEFWNQTIHLEPSVGEWVERQGVSAVAMDCFPEKPFWMMTLTAAERGANHKRWLKAGIPMIQMLTALDRIAPKFMLTALPLKLQGMDGAPARVIGIEP